VWEGLWSKGPTRNDYEASGEFGVRTEGPKRERRIEEDVLPGIRGRWREGEEILRRERGVKGSHSETIYAAARQGLKKKLNNPRSLQAPYSRPEISRQPDYHSPAPACSSFLERGLHTRRPRTSRRQGNKMK
jgi:hypothetical protein